MLRLEHYLEVPFRPIPNKTIKNIRSVSIPIGPNNKSGRFTKEYVSIRMTPTTYFINLNQLTRSEMFSAM